MIGIDDAVAAVSSLIDKALSFIPNPEERAKAAQAMQATAMQFTQQLTLAQIDVNKTEATSNSLFVSGWRPAVGWCCVATLAWNYTAAPLLTWALQVGGVTVPPLPTLDSIMAQTLFGILGLNVAARTYEKVQGVASRS